MNYILGIDLGTKQDYSALVLARRVERMQDRRALPGTWQAETEIPRLYSTYEIPLIQRPPLGIDYAEVIAGVQRILELPELFRQQVAIVVDASGVGYPVMQQMFAVGLPVTGVTITGGTSVAENESGYTVPKRDLVSSLQVVYQSRRIKIAKRLPMAEALREELQSFHQRMSKAGNEKWDAASGKHDDIVLALAIAIWYGERAFGYTVAAPVDEHRDTYDPMRAVMQD